MAWVRSMVGYCCKFQELRCPFGWVTCGSSFIGEYLGLHIVELDGCRCCWYKPWVVRYHG